MVVSHFYFLTYPNLRYLNKALTIICECQICSELINFKSSPMEVEIMNHFADLLFRFLGESRLALRDVLNSPNLAASFTVSLLDTKRNNTGVSMNAQTNTHSKAQTDSFTVLLYYEAMTNHKSF